MSDARRPFIKFEVVTVEDRQTMAATGQHAFKDVDYIVIIPHGSEGKTELREEYNFWVEKMQRQIGPVRAPGGDTGTPFVVESRFPREWLDEIIKGYKAWKEGKELPLDGTALQQWGVLPPAMLQTFLAQHIRTIEELAEASDEAINPCGMGSRLYRNHAVAWVKLNKEGTVTRTAAEVTALRAENAELKATIGSLSEKLDSLIARLPNTDTTAVLERHNAARKVA